MMNSILKNRFALLFLAVLLFVTTIPFLSGKLSIFLPFILAFLLFGVYPEFLYFSFSTLTTPGYGDISPTGRISRSLTTIEAITGPVFLTVLVFRLVGHSINRSSAGGL